MRCIGQISRRLVIRMRSLAHDAYIVMAGCMKCTVGACVLSLPKREGSQCGVAGVKYFRCCTRNDGLVVVVCMSWIVDMQD